MTGAGRRGGRKESHTGCGLKVTGIETGISEMTGPRGGRRGTEVSRGQPSAAEPKGRGSLYTKDKFKVEYNFLMIVGFGVSSFQSGTQVQAEHADTMNCSSSSHSSRDSLFNKLEKQCCPCRRLIRKGVCKKPPFSFNSAVQNLIFSRLLEMTILRV